MAHFYQRGNTLQVRVNNLRMSTGIRIPPSATFSPSAQLFFGKGVVGINAEIDRHRQFISECDNLSDYGIFTQPIIVIDPISCDIVNICRQFMAGFRDGSILTVKQLKAKTKTISTYQFAVNTLINYATPQPKIDLLDYNLSHVKDVNKKRQIASRWQKWFDGMVKSMDGNKVNTKATVMQIIAAIVSHYEKEFFLQLPPIPRVKSVDNPIVVLPQEFIRQFLNDGLYSSLTGELRYTWEVCATIMVTTMRIGDATGLKWDNLSDRADGLFLEKWNGKTGAYTSMILPRQLADVYRSNMSAHGHIFSPEADLYEWIPRLFKTYESLNRSVSVSNLNLKGELEMTTLPLWEWVKPHMLRKTAITSMLANGVSEQHVKFASGHSDKSQAFNKYRGFVERNFNNQLNTYYENFS